LITSNLAGAICGSLSGRDSVDPLKKKEKDDLNNWEGILASLRGEKGRSTIETVRGWRTGGKSESVRGGEGAGKGKTHVLNKEGGGKRHQEPYREFF